jgi:PPOX class probable F420-dependent enzyme
VRLAADETQARFAGAQVARLATANELGQPHIVPIVFALDSDVIYTAIDWKPKTSRQLRRLANIAANSQVAVLADHYANDWTQLWWARADGIARIAGGAESERALELLSARYAQYAQQRPPGPVIAIDVQTWTGWAAAG